jgi:hypothetical protein
MNDFEQEAEDKKNVRKKEKSFIADTPKAVVPKPEETKINLETFLRIKKYNAGIKARLQTFMLHANDTEFEKPMSEWEAMYGSAMKRITK